MHIKNFLTDWTKWLTHSKPTKEIVKQVQQIGDQLPHIWQKMQNSEYGWTKNGLEQVRSCLQICSKNNKHIQKQIKGLTQQANSQLIPVFKNQTFLKTLATKMNLSPHTINSIHSLLDKFTGQDSSFSPSTLLILVLFIALGAQVPLIIKGSFNAKKAFFAVTTVLDYVATAIQLAQEFKKHKTKK